MFQHQELAELLLFLAFDIGDYFRQNIHRQAPKIIGQETPHSVPQTIHCIDNQLIVLSLVLCWKLLLQPQNIFWVSIALFNFPFESFL